MKSYLDCMSSFDPAVDRMRGFAICALPRSGSHLLCDYCESTGELGIPKEYLNGDGRRRRDWSDYPREPSEQVDCILKLGATPNGVYAVKVFPQHLDALNGLNWSGRLPDLDFVYLERRDMLGQAISWARAGQTDQFRADLPMRGQAAYDPELISRLMLDIVVGRSRWELYFARNGIAPLRIAYEDLEADPAITVGRIATRLGLDPVSIDPARVRVTRQRDEQSEAWRRRYVAEFGDRAVFDRVEMRGPVDCDAQP